MCGIPYPPDLPDDIPEPKTPKYPTIPDIPNYDPPFNPCGAGHIILWTSGNSGDSAPEGTPCMCGMFKAHYVKCGWCGHQILNMIPYHE